VFLIRQLLVGESSADVLIKVRTLGIGRQESMIQVRWQTEIEVDSMAAEFEPQKLAGVIVVNGSEG